MKVKHTNYVSFNLTPNELIKVSEKYEHLLNQNVRISSRVICEILPSYRKGFYIRSCYLLDKTHQVPIEEFDLDEILGEKRVQEIINKFKKEALKKQLEVI